jgi:hypothetical protein
MLQALDEHDNIDVTYNGTIDSSATDPNLLFAPTVWSDGQMFIELTALESGPLLLVLFDQDNPSIGSSIPCSGA